MLFGCNKDTELIWPCVCHVVSCGITQLIQIGYRNNQNRPFDSVRQAVTLLVLSLLFRRDRILAEQKTLCA